MTLLAKLERSAIMYIVLFGAGIAIVLLRRWFGAYSNWRETMEHNRARKG